MNSHLVRSSRVLPALAAAGLVWLGSGCSTVTQVGGVVGQATGMMTADQAEALHKTGQATDKVMESFTPEQEYYVGRAVTATVLNTYKPFDQQQANDYLNLVGQTVAQFSTKPETFGGYHFLLLETEDVNAFAAPGGLITVSRGMVRCCKSEDELVAVLAHEVSHVEHEHGLKAIKKGRWTSAIATSVSSAGQALAGAELAQATQAFTDCIGDIASTMMNNGYSRTTEFEADKGAVAIMQKLGYDPNALVAMLEQMQKQLKPGGHDFAKTHPAPEARIAALKKIVGAPVASPTAAARQERFQKAMSGI